MSAETLALILLAFLVISTLLDISLRRQHDKLLKLHSERMDAISKRIDIQRDSLDQLWRGLFGEERPAKEDLQ